MRASPSSAVHWTPRPRDRHNARCRDRPRGHGTRQRPRTFALQKSAPVTAPAPCTTNPAQPPALRDAPVAPGMRGGRRAQVIWYWPWAVPGEAGGGVRLALRQPEVIRHYVRMASPAGTPVPMIRPDRRCGWPETCKEPGHDYEPTAAQRRRPWGYHDIQCQKPNPRPGPHLDGYPACYFMDGHEGPCDYVRHAMEKPRS